MKIIILNATIYMNEPETVEEERKEETKEEAADDTEPAPAKEEPPKEVIETPKKKKFPIPVNSPESFAICRRIAEEERKRKKMTANPINGKIEKRPRKPRIKVTDELEAKVREMTKQGISIAKTADQLNVSAATVQRIRKRQETEEKYGH